MLKKFTAAILAAALAISSAGVPQLAYGKEVEAHVTPNDAVESQGGG